MSNRELFVAQPPGNYRGRRKPNITNRSKAWNVTGMANRTAVPVASAILMRMRCGGNLNGEKSEKKAQRERASPR